MDQNSKLWSRNAGLGLFPVELWCSPLVLPKLAADHLAEDTDQRCIVGERRERSDKLKSCQSLTQSSVGGTTPSACSPGGVNVGITMRLFCVPLQQWEQEMDARLTLTFSDKLSKRISSAAIHYIWTHTVYHSGHSVSCRRPQSRAPAKNLMVNLIISALKSGGRFL